MVKIFLYNINYSGFLKFSLLGNVKEVIDFFSGEFIFGNCYCLDSELTRGGWGISWFIAGCIEQQMGKVLLDDKEFKKSERRKISQCVGTDINNYFFLGKKTIKKQIKRGLKVTQYKNAKTVGEIVKLFKLAEEKIDRIIEHVSAMRFKASMAIGYAFDKKIYCFPWIWSEGIIDFKDLWLKELITFLKSKNCLILLPTKYNKKMDGLFDEVVSVKRKLSD